MKRLMLVQSNIPRKGVNFGDVRWGRGGARQRRATVKRIRGHPWCQSETFASSRTLFAYAPFAAGYSPPSSPSLPLIG